MGLYSLILKSAVAALMVGVLFPHKPPMIQLRVLDGGSVLELAVNKPSRAALADLHLKFEPPVAPARMLAQQSAAQPAESAVPRRRLQPLTLNAEAPQLAKSDKQMPVTPEPLEAAALPAPERTVYTGFTRLPISKPAAPGAAAVLAQSQKSPPARKMTADQQPSLFSGWVRKPEAKVSSRAKAPSLGGMITHSKTPSPQSSSSAGGAEPVETFETAQSFRDRAHVLAGTLELTSGLALTSSADQVSVYRQLKGERLEVGYVNYNQGKFEIYVSELRGDLSGELRDARGQVVGQGLISLDNVYTDQFKVSNLSLFLEPVHTGLTGKVYDFAQALREGKEKAIGEAKVEYPGFTDFLRTMPDGIFLEARAAAGSQALIRASRKGHLPTLAYLQEGRLQDVPLVSESALKEFLQAKDTKGGVILGRVLQGGEPAAGAKVSLYGLEEQPLYLSEKGQPLAKGETGPSGYFVFTDLPVGLEAVQVQFRGRTEARVLPVGAGTVSFLPVDMKLENEVEVAYRSFPGDEPVPMSTRALATAELWRPQFAHQGKLQLAKGADPLFVVADGGEEDLEPMTYSVLRESSLLELPVLKSSWVQNIYARLHLLPMAQSGQVLGWLGAPSSFVVELDQLDGEPSAQVLYLDPFGAPLWEAQEGVPGGSYLLLNVEEGLRKVRLYLSSGEQSSCLAYLEAATTAVCTH